MWRHKCELYTEDSISHFYFKQPNRNMILGHNVTLAAIIDVITSNGYSQHKELHLQKTYTVKNEK